jgi:hypothetical protein
MPTPGPSSSHRRCSLGEPSANRGYHAKGTDTTRPSRNSTMSARSDRRRDGHRASRRAAHVPRIGSPADLRCVLRRQPARSPAGRERQCDRRSGTARRSHKAERSEALERNVLRVFERANRTIMPSPEAGHRSGDLVSEMAKHERLETARISKAFANDILLALSCRESGCVLVTENDCDFSRIRRFISCEYASVLR